MSQTTLVALVTGTSSGFGRAIAAALATAGHQVYGTVRSAGSQTPPGVSPVTLDITRDDEVAAGVESVMRNSGRIDVLVNNAGIGIGGAIEDFTVEEAKEQFDTNFFGTHRMCRAVLPHMRAAGRGHIVNMGSLGGKIAVPFGGFYCASKFALEAYSEAMRMEVRPFGISVSVIEPGDFATSITSNRRMSAETVVASAYYERCTRAEGKMSEDEQKNKDLSPVVNAVLEIVSSRAPALRYPVATATQRFLVALRNILPQTVFQKMLADYYGI